MKHFQQTIVAFRGVQYCFILPLPTAQKLGRSQKHKPHLMLKLSSSDMLFLLISIIDMVFLLTGEKYCSFFPSSSTFVAFKCNLSFTPKAPSQSITTKLNEHASYSLLSFKSCQILLFLSRGRTQFHFTSESTDQQLKTWYDLSVFSRELLNDSLYIYEGHSIPKVSCMYYLRFLHNNFTIL